eukprot:9488225-Pyramimonas_sp.AAC.1
MASRAADVSEAGPPRQRRRRDLFPLPLPADGERSFVATDLSRVTKKRLHRASHRREMVVDAVRATNEMYTGSCCPRPTGLASPVVAQQKGLAVIQEA